MPRWAFREEPSAAVAARVMIGLSGLMIPALLLTALALPALRRYPL